MKRVMLVDDHPIVRAGIQRLFADCTDIVVDCEAATGREALMLLESRSVDGVLLDLSMPDVNGIEVLRQLKATRSTLPVLVLSMHSEDQFAINALQAGANGYLEKSKASDEIIEATRAVLHGKTYVSAAIDDVLVRTAASGRITLALHEKLSAREFEVFRLLATGLTVARISDQLVISVKTVSTHRARILSKMRLKSNADLTYYALKNALIE